MPTRFLTEDQAKAIAPFMTNPNGRVSALINVPGIVAGSAFSRLSRTEKTVAQVLLTEFMVEDPESELGYRPDMQKGNDFYERVFASYGDESVAELLGGHVAITEVSNIAIKFLQNARIGLSPLEKSTRYVYYDKRPYLYYVPEELRESDELFRSYNDTTEALFDTYAELHPPVEEYLKELYPKKDDEDEKAWKQSIKGKVADTLRLLLPAATLTNAGFFGNARAFEKLIYQCRASEYEEVRQIGAELQQELLPVFGRALARVFDPVKGGAQIEYYQRERELLKKWSKTVQVSHPLSVEQDYVTLVEFDPLDEDRVLAALLFSEGIHSLSDLMESLDKTTPNARSKFVRSFAEIRKTRFHKPGRAFEHAYLLFEILANFGVYKDLQRHRMLTQMRQKLTCRYGYDTPKLILDLADRHSEVVEKWVQAMEKPVQLVEQLGNSKWSYLAEYPVPNGYRFRWEMGGNLREWTYLTELRSGQSGHPDYRFVAQEITRQIQQAHPILSEIIKFVDFGDYGLERRAASQHEAEKLKRFGAEIDVD